MGPPPTKRESKRASRLERSRGSAATWFRDHYEATTGQVIEVLDGNGFSFSGRHIADVGCGDGILTLGPSHCSRAETSAHRTSRRSPSVIAVGTKRRPQTSNSSPPSNSAGSARISVVWNASG